MIEIYDIEIQFTYLVLNLRIMKKLLKKLKLFEDFTMELNIRQKDFLKNLKDIVDEREKGFFVPPSPNFSSRKKEFEGKVGDNGFHIKRKKKSFDFGIYEAKATGTFKQTGDKLVVNTKIYGFSKKLIPFYIFISLFFFVFIFVFFSTENLDPEYRTYVGLILFSSALLMFVLPYVLMKNDTQALKYKLEKEFYYMTR